LWTSLYNTTWFRLDRLYNTVVMGSLAVALAAFVPLFLLANWLVRRYRVHIRDWIARLPLAQTIKASKLFTVYKKISDLGGAA